MLSIPSQQEPHFVLQSNLDTDFDAGGKVSVGLTATTIVSQWTWAATLLQSSGVAARVSLLISTQAQTLYTPLTYNRKIPNHSKFVCIRLMSCFAVIYFSTNDLITPKPLNVAMC